MATGMFGANPAQLRDVGARFHSLGGSIESVGFNLRGEIEGVEWFGSDAEAFVANWGDKLHLDLTGLGRTLQDIRGELDRQAGDQDSASEGGGRDEGCVSSTWDAVTGFVGNLAGAIWGDVQGIAALFGFDENFNWSWDNLATTWSGMGMLIGYNPNDGTWGNWDLAWEAVKYVGKSMVAWDDWGTDNSYASATAIWNVGSNFIPFGALGKVGKLGMVADDIADVGRVADDLADLGRVADDLGDLGRVADDLGDVGRVGDDLADAGRVGDDLADTARNTPPGHWNSKGSPDVPDTTRTKGVDGHKMSLHNPPYDTGATIDPVTGDLISTSKHADGSFRTFDADHVSNHYTTATGQADGSLRVSTAEGTTPFKTDHRYVLDDGKTVIETNSLGQPDYTRYTMDGRAMKENGGFSSDPYRKGTQTSAKNWPDHMTNPGDQRGHGMPAQHKGPNEDINTMPQSPKANQMQADVEMAISDHFYDNPGSGPLIVERRVDFHDGGHAANYHFTVTDNSGKQLSFTDNKGRPIPMSFPD